jgi:hypothetical protein
MWSLAGDVVDRDRSRRPLGEEIVFRGFSTAAGHGRRADQKESVAVRRIPPLFSLIPQTDCICCEAAVCKQADKLQRTWTKKNNKSLTSEE